MLAKTRNRIEKLEQRVRELEYDLSIYIPLYDKNGLNYGHKWVRTNKVLRSLFNHLNLDIKGKEPDDPVIFVPKI